MPSCIYDSIRGNKVCVSGVFLGENINTLLESCFVDKNVFIYVFIQKQHNLLFVHTSENQQSTVYRNGLAMLGSLSCVLFTLINSPLVN